MRAGLTRTAIITLMTLELIYMSFWVALIVIVKAGLWSQDWFGFDGDNIVAVASAFQVYMVFTVTFLILLSLISMIRYKTYTLYIFLLSVIAHFVMWVSLLDNDYYSGDLGFFVIIVEGAITILLLNLPRNGFLK